tara:strand:- start:6122 stop:6283 length:162 start_codon:yes stop_codon:yes gene_type:complete
MDEVAQDKETRPVFCEIANFSFNELNLISFYSSIINFKTTLIASNQLRFIFHF